VSAGDIASTPPTFAAPPVVKPPEFSYADFTYDPFNAPTASDVYADPSFQLRFGMGQKALENSRAAMGTIGTGAAIKDFINYGQNFASQEYGNVYDRAARTYAMNRGNALDQYATNRANAVGNYNLNYQTQYTDPWQESYANAKAAMEPALLGYTTQVGAAQHAQDAYDALATHARDQYDLYGFNNKVFDFDSSLARDQFDWTKQRASSSDAFDQWYRRMLIELQASA